jgi:putative ABC transport system permease protein
MEHLAREIRQAVGSLRRAPGFTTAALATLGFGIGASVLVWGTLHAVLFRPLPLRDAGAVVAIHLRTPENERYPLSIPDLLDYQAESASFEGLAAIAGCSLNLTGRGDAERLQGVRVAGNFFDLLGVAAAIGRTLRPEDDAAGAKVAVLSDGLWRRRYGADPAIVGQAMLLNGEPHEVVGVLPRDFRFPLQTADVAVPLAAERDPVRQDRRATGLLRTVGRLRPGVSAAAARAEMNAIAARLREAYPDANATKIGVNVTPYLDEVTGTVRPPLFVLAGAVLCVLLVGCANLSGLALVRASGRSRELGVRAALGATRGRLARLLLIEGLVLAAMGGLLGILAGLWGLQAVAALPPRVLPRAHEVRPDLFTFLFGAGLAAAAGLLCGGLPALLAGRTEPLAALKGGMAGTAATASLVARALGRAPLRRSRRLLVAFEVAMAMLLLAGAGLLLRSYVRFTDVDPGFEQERVLVARLALPRGRYARPEPMVRFHDALLARLRALPGVEAAGMISIAPMSGPLATAEVQREDRPPADPRAGEAAHYRMVSPGYFATMRIPILRGRDFSDEDRAGTPAVGIVNETLARHLFAEEDPVGRALVVDDAPAGSRRVTIVGVARDVRHERLDVPPAADLHLPAAQVIPDTVKWLANNQFWSVRTSSDPALLARAMQEAVRSIDPEVSASAFRTQEEIVADVSGTERLSLSLVAAFAAAALLLAAMGVYGLVAFSVAQRRREIGIRVALGARGGAVERLVALEGLRLAGAGLIAGGIAALAASRLLAGFLFGITPHDPATFAGVAACLLAASLLASWLPARAAARIPPTEALRAD